VSIQLAPAGHCLQLAPAGQYLYNYLPPRLTESLQVWPVHYNYY